MAYTLHLCDLLGPEINREIIADVRFNKEYQPIMPVLPFNIH